MAQNQNISNLGQYLTVNTAANLVTFSTQVELLAVKANGSFGTANQVLVSNGTAVYWGAGGFTNGQSISVNGFSVNGTFTANGSVGSNGQVLTSNGSVAYWANTDGAVGVSAQTIYNSFVGNGSVNTYTITVPSTTNNALVTINGVTQQPTNAYSVSGTTLTFTANVPNNAVVGVYIPTLESVSGTVSQFINYKFVAANNQTTFNGNDANGRYLQYDVGYITVYKNGYKLATSDYTASTGNDLVLNTGAANNDVVEVVSFAAMYVTNPNNSFYVANAVTTTNTASYNVDSFSASVYRSATYFAQVTDNSSNNYHIQNINLVHNGSTVWMSEYGAIYSNGSSLATFDAAINSGNVYLTVTPVTNTSIIRVLRTAIII